MQPVQIPRDQEDQISKICFDKRKAEVEDREGLMKQTERERKKARYQETRLTGMSHAIKPNGKTYCGRYLAWNIEVKDVFTCKSCEIALSKYKEVLVRDELGDNDHENNRLETGK